MRINETKSALANVWDLINDANGTTFSISSPFTLAVPQPYGGPQPRNTSVLVSANEGSGYQGQLTVYYNRRGMKDNVANPPDGFTVANDATSESLLASMVAQLNLVASDVELAEPLTFRMPQITLQPKPNSYLYDTGTVFTITWPLPHISELITQPLLNGFDKVTS